MQVFRKRGIILGKTRFKESSLIVRTLMEDGSVVSLMFKGALKSKSNINSHIISFALIEFIFYAKPERSIHTASEAIVIEDLSHHFTEYNSQARMARYIKKAVSIIKPEQAVVEIFDLVMALMRNFNAVASVNENILWSGFILKLLIFAGYEPAISLCAGCGGKIPTNMKKFVFSPSAGGFLCENHPLPNDAIMTEYQAIRTLQFLMGNPFKSYSSLNIPNNKAKELREMLEKFWAFYVSDKEF